MATPSPGRSTQQNVASMAQKGAPGTRGGSRPGLSPIRAGLSEEAPQTSAGLVWVEIEPEADIVPKVNPYLSFDPDGTYPPP